MILPMRASLPFLVVLSLGGCSGERSSIDPTSIVDRIDEQNVVEIPEKRPRRIRLTPRLQAGQSTLRDFKLEIDAHFPPGLGGADNLSHSRTRRHRLSREHVLAANGGKPDRIRRTYEQTLVREEVQRTDGRRSRISSNPLAGVTLILEPGPDGQVAPVRIEGTGSLPYGVEAEGLGREMVLDVISLARWLPPRTVAPGDSWPVPPGSIVDLFGRTRPGCTYTGQIEVRYDRSVLYDGKRAAHLALKIRVDQDQQAIDPARFRKKTTLALDGAIYYSIESGRPLFVSLRGPLRIDFEPLADEGPTALSHPARCAGMMNLSIRFRTDPASSVR